MESLYQVVQRAMQGNNDAFAELYNLKGQSIIYLCTKNLGNLQDGEDAAQEVFIRIHKSIAQLKDPKAFNGWMYSIIQNTCNNLRRNNMKNSGHLPIDDYSDLVPEKNLEYLPEEFLEDDEKKHQLLSIINRLSRNQRMSVVLFYFEGLTQAEIADVLEISVNTVNSCLHRARVKIRQAIDGLQENASKVSVMLPMLLLKQLFQQEADMVVSSDVISRCTEPALRLLPPSTPAASAMGRVGLAKITTAAAFTLAVSGFCLVVAVSSAFLTFASYPALRPIVASVPQRSPEYSQSLLEDTASSMGATARAGSVPVQGNPAPATPPQNDNPASTQPPATPNTAPPKMFEATIEGSIMMKTREDTLLENGGKYAAGFLVYLLNGDVRLASTTINDVGNYAFKPLLLAAGHYQIQLAIPTSRRAVYTQDNPNGIVGVEVTLDGDIVGGSLYITDHTPPAISIMLYGEDGTPTRVNPRIAELKVDDNTETHATLAIYAKADGSPLSEGTLATINTALHKGLPLGDYTLAAYATDACGNTTQQELDFQIA